jgi:hypothetical protein
MVSLICETDEDFVQNATIFLSHIAVCPECRVTATKGEGLECIESIFGVLSKMAGITMVPPAYGEAVAFCRCWLAINRVEPKADQIIIHATSTKH